MCAAVHYLSAHQAKQRRQLLVEAMCASNNSQTGPDRQHENHADSKDISLATNETGTESPMLCASERRAIDIVQRLHPTAALLSLPVRRQSHRFSGPSSTFPVCQGHWRKRLPWGLEVQQHQDPGITSSPSRISGTEGRGLAMDRKSFHTNGSLYAEWRDAKENRYARHDAYREKGQDSWRTTSLASEVKRLPQLASYDVNYESSISKRGPFDTSRTARDREYNYRQQQWQPPTATATTATPLSASLLDRMKLSSETYVSPLTVEAHPALLCCSPAGRRSSAGMPPKLWLGDELHKQYSRMLDSVLASLGSQQRQKFQPEQWRIRHEKEDAITLQRACQVTLLEREEQAGNSGDERRCQRARRILKRLHEESQFDVKRVHAFTQLRGCTSVFQLARSFDRLSARDLGEMALELQPQLASEMQGFADRSNRFQGPPNGSDCEGMFIVDELNMMWCGLFENAEREEAEADQAAAQLETLETTGASFLEILRCAVLGSFWLAGTSLSKLEILDPLACACLGPLYLLLMVDYARTSEDDGMYAFLRHTVVTAVSLYNVILYGPTSPLASHDADDFVAGKAANCLVPPRYSAEHITCVMSAMQENPLEMVLFSNLCKALSKMEPNVSVRYELARDYLSWELLSSREKGQTWQGAGSGAGSQDLSMGGSCATAGSIILEPAATSGHGEEGDYPEHHQLHREQSESDLGQQNQRSQQNQRTQPTDVGAGTGSTVWRWWSPGGEGPDAHEECMMGSARGGVECPLGAEMGNDSPAEAEVYVMDEGYGDCVPCVYDSLWALPWPEGPASSPYDDLTASLPWASGLIELRLLDIEYGNAEAEGQLLSVLRDAARLIRSAGYSPYFHSLDLKAAKRCDQRRNAYIALRQTYLTESQSVDRSLMEEGMQRKKTVAESAATIEALRPGLLAAHPDTWGGLLRRGQEEGSPASAAADPELWQPQHDEVVQCAIIGLMVLAGQDVPLEKLRLSYCVATGRYWQEAVKVQPASLGEATGHAVDFFFFLYLVPPFLSVPPDEDWIRQSPILQAVAQNWPEMPRAGLPRTHASVQGYMLKLLIHQWHFFKKHNILSGALMDCMRLACSEPWSARCGNPQYKLLLDFVAAITLLDYEEEVDEYAHGVEPVLGGEMMDVNEYWAEEEEAPLALLYLRDQQPERQNTLLESFYYDPGGALRPPLPFLPPFEERRPEQKAVNVTGAGELEVVYIGADLSVSQLLPALLTLLDTCSGLPLARAGVQASAAFDTATATAGGSPLPARAYLVSGAEHITLVLLLLHGLSKQLRVTQQQVGGHLPHPGGEFVFRPWLHEAEAARRAAAADGEVEAPRPSPDREGPPAPITVRLDSVYFGWVPEESDPHFCHVRRWQSSRMNSLSSERLGAATKRSAYEEIEVAREALLQREMGVSWICGRGVGGIPDALVVAAQVASEMEAQDMQLGVSVRRVDFPDGRDLRLCSNLNRAITALNLIQRLRNQDPDEEATLSRIWPLQPSLGEQAALRHKEAHRNSRLHQCIQQAITGIRGVLEELREEAKGESGTGMGSDSRRPELTIELQLNRMGLVDWPDP